MTLLESRNNLTRRIQGVFNGPNLRRCQPYLIGIHRCFDHIPQTEDSRQHDQQYAPTNEQGSISVVADKFRGKFFVHDEWIDLPLLSQTICQ